MVLPDGSAKLDDDERVKETLSNNSSPPEPPTGTDSLTEQVAAATSLRLEQDSAQKADDRKLLSFLPPLSSSNVIEQELAVASTLESGQRLQLTEPTAFANAVSRVFSTQLQDAVDDFLEKNSETTERAREIDGYKLLTNNSLGDKGTADLFRNTDIVKLFYYDVTKSKAEDISNEGLTDQSVLKYNNKQVKTLEESLGDIGLTTDTLLRYADDGSLFPTFVLDQKLYIQGVEVSKYLKGNVSVSKNNVTGHNTLTFTLDNANDQFVWTDRNLGSGVFNRSYFYNENGEKVYYSSKDKELEELANTNGVVTLDQELDAVQRAVIREPFLQHEEVKKRIYDYKKNTKINPIGVDAAGNKMFTRFDLVPNKCIFARMDPIRLFTAYPFRASQDRLLAGKEKANSPETFGVGETLARAARRVAGIPEPSQEIRNPSPELWIPEFAGFIEHVSIEDDDINGTSTITIECSDIRQSILTRMRISNSVSSSLTNPLDLLGLKPLAIYDEGEGRTTSGNNATPEQQALIETIRKESPRFFNENDKTVTFYDDVVNSVYGTLIPPNLNIEGTVRELLEFKYDALVQGRARRGVNNIKYGGTFRTPWSVGSGDYNVVRSYLQEYHLFTLFGPKRRPWTIEEVEEVGYRTITVDPRGEYLGLFSPLNCRLWFLLPKNYTGPANLAELTTANIQFSHESNWTNRIEILRNVIEGVDYQMIVSGTGDIHIEFPFADFRPEDFGIFKNCFRFNRATVSTSYSDEAEEPVAGLAVVTGFSAGADTQDRITEAYYQTAFAFSPYIAARYGMGVTQSVSVPYLSIKDKPIAIQRAAVEFQKANARCNTVQFQSAFRPFLLPNRPVHHLRRSRMGIIVSADTSFDIGASPRASISVGLEHVRAWTGGYQSEAVPPSQQPTEYQNRKTDRNSPADQKDDLNDPYTQQVFTSVMAGTNLPMSNRATWDEKSPLAANSGVYVIDLMKFNEEQVSTEAPETPTPPAADQTPVAETASPVKVTPPPAKELRKWAGNPLKTMRATSHWSPVRVILEFKGGTLIGPHTGTDFGGSPGTELLAVNDGVVYLRGNNVHLDGTNGLKAVYVHCSPLKIIPKSNFPDSESADYLKAKAAAHDYAVREQKYRSQENAILSDQKNIKNKIIALNKEIQKEKSKGKPTASLEADLRLQENELKNKTTELNSVRTFKPVKPSSKYYMVDGATYKVKTEEVIAFVSDVGLGSGPHLHFETWDKENPLNWPYDYVKEGLTFPGAQIPNGSIQADSYLYLPGPISGVPHINDVAGLDAQIRDKLAKAKAKKKK